MEAYLHLKSERDDCFQTIKVPARKVETSKRIGHKVLFNSRWRRVWQRHHDRTEAGATVRRYERYIRLKEGIARVQLIEDF